MSLFTLRKHNPEIRVYFVTDTRTCLFLSGHILDTLGSYAEVISLDVPPEFNTEQLCSRYLKTSVRKLISGDFIFLDCDTIVCRPFSLDDFKGIDIGMVADLNISLPLSDEKTLLKCKNAGFPDLQGVPYYNSGFFFVKDVPFAYRFFETWHQLWRESILRGCFYDQPALCETNRQLGFPIQELSGKWNCQIKFSGSLRCLNDAIVLHYFAADGSANRSFHVEELLRRVRDNGIDSTVEVILNSSSEALSAFFCQQSDSVLRFIGTEMFNVYSEDYSTFRLAERLAKVVRRVKKRLALLLVEDNGIHNR